MRFLQVLVVLRTLVSALGDLVSPHAHTGFPVVSKSGAALVAGGFSVPAVPEDVALGFVGEDTVQPLAVRGGDWRLCRTNRPYLPDPEIYEI